MCRKYIFLYACRILNSEYRIFQQCFLLLSDLLFIQSLDLDLLKNRFVMKSFSSESFSRCHLVWNLGIQHYASFSCSPQIKISWMLFISMTNFYLRAIGKWRKVLNHKVSISSGTFTRQNLAKHMSKQVVWLAFSFVCAANWYSRETSGRGEELFTSLCSPKKKNKESGIAQE